MGARKSNENSGARSPAPTLAHPKSAKLYLHELPGPNERAALRRLKPAWGNREHRQQFQQLVLGHLAAIAGVFSTTGKGKTLSRPVVGPPWYLMPPRYVEKLRRAADKCRNLANRLSTQNFGTGLRHPAVTKAVEACNLCAEALETEANDLTNDAKRRLRHSTHPQTREISKLVCFVEEQTGKPHWTDIATLLRGPTGDAGYTGRRLEALIRAHRKRGRPQYPFPRVTPSPRVRP
jgi:hypothetical protein